MRIEVPLRPGEDPKKCTDWKTINVPTNVLQHLQTRNRVHFGQAKTTPFTTSPLGDELGFTGHLDTAQEILQGTYDSSKLPSPVRLLISHLQHRDCPQLSSQRPFIEDDEYTAKLKCWSKTTSTSPSGLHLGHYKALVVRHMYSELQPDEPDRVKWDNMQSELRTLHLTLMNYGL
jgi:hypothetical protein